MKVSGRGFLDRDEIAHFRQVDFNSLLNNVQDVPKKLCPVCVATAQELYISVFTQVHRSSFNLEFETLLESICHVVADLWKRKGKISGCFKNSTSVFLQQCQDKVSFQRKGSGIVLKFSQNFSRG